VDSVSFASKVVGLLFKWVLSQLHFAHAFRQSAKAQCSPTLSIKTGDEHRRLVTPEAVSNTLACDFQSVLAASHPGLPDSVHVPFDHHSAQLSFGATRILQTVASFMIEHCDAQMEVVGVSKCNEVQNLGLKRALAVIDYMIDEGLTRCRFIPAEHRSAIPVTGAGTFGFVELRKLAGGLNTVDGTAHRTASPSTQAGDLQYSPPTPGLSQSRPAPQALRRSLVTRLPAVAPGTLRGRVLAGEVGTVAPQVRSSPAAGQSQSRLAAQFRVSASAQQDAPRDFCTIEDVGGYQQAPPRRREVVRPWANRLH